MKRNYSKIVLLLVAIILTSNALSQNINYQFKKLAISEGLSHTDATDIVQDDQGFIWIATYGGLNRFDGYEVKVFTNEQEQIRRAFNNRISKIALDNMGLVWLATQGGLKVFDTKIEQFISYRGLEQHEELSLELKSIFFYDQSTIFFSSVNGQTYGFKMRNEEGEIVLEKVFESSFFFLNATKDYKGNVWFDYGPSMKFLRYFANPNGWKVINVSTEDQFGTRRSINAACLITDQKNQLVGNLGQGYFVANLQEFYNNERNLENGFLKIRNYPFNIDKIRESYPATENVRLNVQNIVENANGDYWFATTYGLVLVEEPVSESPSYLAYFHNDYDKNSLTSNEINSLFIDNSQCLWLTTWGGGVNYFDLNQKKFYLLTQRLDNTRNTLSGKYVRAILEDDKGNIWVGTRASGLSYYDFKKNKFSHIRSNPNDPNSLQSDQIRSLMMDKQKRLWIGTTLGISIYDTRAKSFDNIYVGRDTPQQLSGAQIYSMALDKYGQVWAGSWLFGLNRISYRKRGDFDIEQIYVDNSTPYQPSDDHITFIYADEIRPEVLVSTKEGGLNRILLEEHGEIKKIVQYRGQEGISNTLSSDFLWPIDMSVDNTIWVGSLGGGLNKVTFDDSSPYGYTAESFSTKEGAPSNDIESILLDSKGYLWLGGNGLSRFDPNTKTFINYDERDGLQSNSFKIGSAHRGMSGRLYFGGVEGMTYFDPQNITQNDNKAEIVLTELQVNNKIVTPGFSYKNTKILERSIQQTEQIRLNHELNNLAIKFASLHYANPNRIKYKYKLEGHDEEVKETDAENRVATYSNLNYGDYTFYVWGTNNDGFWNTEPAKLEISIITPWWDTIYLKVVYVLLGISLLVGIYLFQSRWLRLKRNLEITLLEEKKMEEMHHMRLQFFTNISHEFRTPLTLILSPLEKMMNEAMDSIQQQRYFKMIYQNSRRLLGLINELMDFRKVESGTIKLQVTRSEINDFLIESSQTFEEHALSRDIHYTVKTNQKLEKIWFDKELMYKVITNLLSNAFKYTKNGGELKVELLTDDELNEPTFKNSFIIDNEQDINKFWWLRVCDSGVGISKESIDHIFQCYYRISDSDKDQHLGSGIGLALVKSLVMLHKGKIKVYSERDKGTEFIVGLPLGKKYFNKEELSYQDQVAINHNTVEINDQLIEPRVNSDHHDIKEDENKQKILIVEDNVEMRQFLKESFEEEYQVLQADDGAEGLKIAKTCFPNLVVSDVMMPVMDGIEFCKAMKEDIEISHIPFVMLTAKSNIENRIEGVESGADAYFSKPFSLKLLKISVANILSSKDRLKHVYQNDVFAEARELVNSQKEKEFVDELIAIVEENIMVSEFDVEHLSREIGISRTKLYNKVKAITGRSVGEFIRKLRMKKAAKIMLSEDITILEVIDRVGIKSQSHFTKAFKKEFGQTPFQFISQYDKQQIES